MKNFLIAILFTIIIYLIWNYFDSYKEISYVIDGDTFKTKDGKSIRLIGINAPEIGEPCSLEAKKKLEELIIGKKLRLEKDVGDKDVYGRLLRYVYSDDLFVNAEMVKVGLARFEEVEPNTKFSSLFLDLENKARKSKGCIWE
jgi:micrococcal nuclease